MLKIGVIGMGGRMAGLTRLLAERHGHDVAITAFSSDFPEYSLAALSRQGVTAAQMRHFADPTQMLAQEDLDGIMIGTRCDAHTDMAILSLPTGLPIFLEKPVAINVDQLQRLAAAGMASASPVLVSFPLRVSPLATMAKKIVDSGEIGTVNHVQAMNNVPYGRGYFHKWYRNDQTTGGLFLQKATHDLDCINYLVGCQPVQIAAMDAKQIFKGDKPAGLKCADCPELAVCPENDYYQQFPESLCCFAEDTGNQDSGSILIRYATGMHAAYSQNFFVRKAAGQRMIRLMGYEGTLEFDWYTNQVKVCSHTRDWVSTHTYDTKAGHFGGDDVLMANFVQMMRGQAAPLATLGDGLVSARMCVAAEQSARTDRFCDLATIN